MVVKYKVYLIFFSEKRESNPEDSERTGFAISPKTKKNKKLLKTKGSMNCQFPLVGKN